MNITFFDVLERAMEIGSIYEPRQWDSKYLPSMVKEKINEHGLENTCDPDNPIPSDDGLADEFWNAGLDLAQDVGMLCLDTKRVIKFSKSELINCLHELPREISVGSGNDLKVFRKRKIEDTNPAHCQLGPFGTMVSEDLFIPIAQSVAQHRIVDGLMPGFPQTSYGREIKTGTPMEIIGIRMRGTLAREAVRRAGRQGMPIGYGGAMMHGGIGATLANPPGMYLATQAGIAELKVDLDTLCKTAIHVERGDVRHSFHHSFIGGYAGSPEGTAITRIAATILITPILQGQIFQCAIYDMRYIGTDGREAVWANSISSQAMSRNSHILSCDTNNPVAGACTDMLLYEVAVNSITDATDGSSWMIGIRTGGGKYLNNTTGLESKFGAEVQKAAAGMKREEANEIVKKIIPKYEDKLMTPPIGKTFPECFNVKTLKPSSEWFEIYKSVWKDLIDLGIPLE
jgi:methylamine--corrinoid protein Co-methyltransferase